MDKIPDRVKYVYSQHILTKQKTSVDHTQGNFIGTFNIYVTDTVSYRRRSCCFLIGSREVLKGGGHISKGADIEGVLLWRLSSNSSKRVRGYRNV